MGADAKHQVYWVELSLRGGCLCKPEHGTSRPESAIIYILSETRIRGDREFDFGGRSKGYSDWYNSVEVCPFAAVASC